MNTITNSPRLFAVNSHHNGETWVDTGRFDGMSVDTTSDGVEFVIGCRTEAESIELTHEEALHLARWLLAAAERAK